MMPTRGYRKSSALCRAKISEMSGAKSKNAMHKEGKLDGNLWYSVLPEVKVGDGVPCLGCVMVEELEVLDCKDFG